MGENLEAGSDAESIKESCLLVCSLWFSQPAFLQIPGPPTMNWTLLHQLLIIKCLQIRVHINIVEAFP